MLSGKNFLTDMEFEERLNQMGDSQIELLKFVARQQYEMSKLCPVHSKKIKNLEHRTRKEMSAVGGIGAFIGAAIVSAIDYFLRR